MILWENIVITYDIHVCVKFDDMSAAEKTHYKKSVISDFVKYGMTELEAVVNYVFCVNPKPLDWLDHRYHISNEEAASLRESGMSKYKENGGTLGCRDIEPSAGRSAKAGSCKCKRPIIPQ